jgi:hypothetical protein
LTRLTFDGRVISRDSYRSEQRGNADRKIILFDLNLKIARKSDLVVIVHVHIRLLDGSCERPRSCRGARTSQRNVIRREHRTLLQRLDSTDGPTAAARAINGVMIEAGKEAANGRKH